MNTTTGIASIGLDCGVKNTCYCVSKTALNMMVGVWCYDFRYLINSLPSETYKQSKEKPNMIIFVMDPGWVKTGIITLIERRSLTDITRLKDMGGEGAVLEIPFSVSEQYKQVINATSKDSGTFKRYDGTILPW